MTKRPKVLDAPPVVAHRDEEEPEYNPDADHSETEDHDEASGLANIQMSEVQKQLTTPVQWSRRFNMASPAERLRLNSQAQKRKVVETQNRDG